MLKSKENAMAAEELEVVSGGTSQETINFIHELIHDGLEISAGKNKRESAIALVQGNEHDVTGMAMAPAFRTALAQLKKSGTSNEPMFPELGWGAAPGVINGLPVDANSTVSFGTGTKDRAIVGNFRDYFRWGFAKDISIEVIEYGNPDNDAEAGDLKGHNQIYIRGECYIGWGILVPDAFARIITT